MNGYYGDVEVCSVCKRVVPANSLRGLPCGGANPGCYKQRLRDEAYKKFGEYLLATASEIQKDVAAD